MQISVIKVLQAGQLRERSSVCRLFFKIMLIHFKEGLLHGATPSQENNRLPSKRENHINAVSHLNLLDKSLLNEWLTHPFFN